MLPYMELVFKDNLVPFNGHFFFTAVLHEWTAKKVLICDTKYGIILLGGDFMYKKNLKYEIHLRLTEDERKFIETLSDLINEKPSFVVRSIINNYRLRYHNEEDFDDVNKQSV